MTEHGEQNNQLEGTGSGTGADDVQDFETKAREELEAAEGADDGKRHEVLDRLYKDLEGALDS